MNIPKLGDWHVIFLHFPIVLFYMVFIYDVLGALFKLRVHPASHWILFFAALLSIPTVISGLALEMFFANNRYIEWHRNFGIATMVFGSLYAAFRLYLHYGKKRVSDWTFVAFSFICVALVTATADWGGLVGFGYGFLKNAVEYIPTNTPPLKP